MKVGIAQIATLMAFLIPRITVYYAFVVGIGRRSTLNPLIERNFYGQYWIQAER
jgi:hypothetical protein